MSRRSCRANNGIVLLLALGVMVVLFILGTAYLEAMTAETLIARNIARSYKALFLAEGGLERGIRHLMDDPATDNLPWETIEYLGEGRYEVHIYHDPDEGVVVISARGVVENASRELQLKVDIPPWKYALFSDTDIAASPARGIVRGDVHANNTAAMGAISVTGTTTQGALGQGFILMPQVVMSYYESIATEVYIGDMVISQNYNGGIVYIKASGNETGKLIIDLTKTKGQFLNINNAVFIAEGGVEIRGDKRLQGFRKRPYPFFITKTGDVIDQRTGISKKFLELDGIIFSERGQVKIDSLTLKGNILAKHIELGNDIDITYDTRFIPVPPPGFIGGVSVRDWEEKGY